MAPIKIASKEIAKMYDKISKVLMIEPGIIDEDIIGEMCKLFRIAHHNR